MNIRSVLNGRADLCVTKALLHSLLHIITGNANLSSDSFKTLSFILNANNVELFLDSPLLDTLLNAIEEFLKDVSINHERDIRPGLRLIETLIIPKPQVHRSISNQILRPLVCLFRGYPFDVEGVIVFRILKIVHDILKRSSSICVSTFFSNAENSSDLDHLKKNLLEVDSRKILNEIRALNQAFNSSVAPKMRFRRQTPPNTIKAKLVDDDNKGSGVFSSPSVTNVRQQFSAPSTSKSVPPNLRRYDRSYAVAPSQNRYNPHSSSQVVNKPAVFRSFQKETDPRASTSTSQPVSGDKIVEDKPGEIFIRRSKKPIDINENDIFDKAIQLFHQTNINDDNEKGAEEKVEIAKVSESRKCLFDWMIDDDSDSSSDEANEGQTTQTDFEVSTELNKSHSRSDELTQPIDTTDADIDMEKLDRWNDDDVSAKTSLAKLPFEETVNVKKPTTPTCSQLTKNHILSVKQSVRVELCEAERFFEIDIGLLATQICGMLNTVNGGTIYLGVKRNGIIKGIRLDRKQKDKVFRNNGLSYSYFPFPGRDTSNHISLFQTRQLLDKVLCYHLFPRVAAASADIKFVEVVDHTYRDVPLSVIVVAVIGEVGAGEDPKYAVCSLPQYGVNGLYVRKGVDPDYNVKIR